MKKNRFYIMLPFRSGHLEDHYQTLSEAIIKVKIFLEKYPFITSMSVVVNGKVVATLPDSTRKG